MRLIISEKRIWSFVLISFLLKITYFIYYRASIEGSVFGGGNDADYYHRYALGFYNLAVNFWPILLRFLNEMGFYDRNIITIITFILSITILPFLFYKMVKIQTDEIKPVMAVSFLLVIFYPTIFYITVDIYREVTMFIFLLLCLIIYKKILGVKLLNSFIYFLIYFGLTYFLYLMRLIQRT